MPIVTKYGSVKSIAQLGKLAGQSIQATREQAIQADLLKQALAFQQQEKIIQFQADLEVETQMMAMKWEQQKMMFRSQQDFEMEQLKQRALIERDLAKQLRKDNEHDMAKDRINKDDSLSDAQKINMLRAIDLRYMGYGGTVGTPKMEDPFEQLTARILAGGIAEGTTGGITGNNIQGTVQVTSPDGVTGTIPAEDWPEAEREGYRRV